MSETVDAESRGRPRVSERVPKPAAPRWFWASTATVATVLGTLALTLSVAASDSDTVVAVFPPWWTPAAVMAAAVSAGSVIDVGRLPATLLVRGERATLGVRLRAAGALIIVDAGAAGGCRTLPSDVPS